MKLTKTEIKELTNLLLNKYNITTRFLNILLNESNEYSLLTDVIGDDLTNEEKVAFGKVLAINFCEFIRNTKSIRRC